jgi:protein required for attachment to host cells
MQPFIPQNTRETKNWQRDQISFPQGLPSVAHNPYQENTSSIPVFDPNAFSHGYNQPPHRNVSNDRLMDTANIFQQNTNQQHHHFMNPVNPYHQQQIVGGVQNQSNDTRQRRHEKVSVEEQRNMDRFFMSQHNFAQETHDRINGFSIIPKDTRYDSSKKMENTGLTMRGNRTMGAPNGTQY